MLRLRLLTLSQEAAERAVAELWCRLEEHGLSTPQLEVIAGANDTFKLSLLFEDTPTAKATFRRWAEEIERRFRDTDRTARLTLV